MRFPQAVFFLIELNDVILREVDYMVLALLSASIMVCNSRDDKTTKLLNFLTRRRSGCVSSVVILPSRCVGVRFLESPLVVCSELIESGAWEKIALSIPF